MDVTRSSLSLIPPFSHSFKGTNRKQLFWKIYKMMTQYKKSQIFTRDKATSCFINNQKHYNYRKAIKRNVKSHCKIFYGLWKIKYSKVGHKARDAVCMCIPSRKRFVNKPESQECIQVSIGCPERDELYFSLLSHCTPYALLIYEIKIRISSNT